MVMNDRYHAVVMELLVSVEQMEDALKKRKQRSKGMGSALSSSSMMQSLGGGNLSDSDKIKLQLLLDVMAFGTDLDSIPGKSRTTEVCNDIPIQ